MSRLLSSRRWIVLYKKTSIIIRKHSTIWDGCIEKIRNFSIIAHVDHGKSTLADRILEDCGVSITNKQSLDTLDVERERGITVKSVSATTCYYYGGETYLLNLIDTPGHIDFNWEVQRSLTACEGVILVIDATEGIQAQTMTNFFLAFELNLKIIPVLNKTDLLHADVERCKKELKEVFDIEPTECIEVSAKTGKNIGEVLKAIIQQIPPPQMREYPCLWCFDADVGNYGGYRYYIKNVGNEPIKNKVKIKALNDPTVYIVKEIGICQPQPVSIKESILPGQIGYIISNTGKTILTGKTLTLETITKDQTIEEVSKINIMKPSVFASFYPTISESFKNFKKSVDGLILNDPVVTSNPCSSPALGGGLRLGFLGNLHLEVFAQRLRSEFQMEVICTAPTVKYRALLHSYLKEKNIEIICSGRERVDLLNPLMVEFEKAVDFVPINFVENYFEQYAQLTIITPAKYFDDLNQLLVEERRGTFLSSESLGEKRLVLCYSVPLSESINDLHGVIKKVSSGFASFELEEGSWKPAKIAVLTITINQVAIPELQFIINERIGAETGRKLVEKFSKSLPIQEFPVTVAAHLTQGPDFQKNNFGKAFGTRKTNYTRGNTKKAKGDKVVDPSRRGKLQKRERDRVGELRMIGNVKVPQKNIIDLFKHM